MLDDILTHKTSICIFCKVPHMYRASFWQPVFLQLHARGKADVLQIASYELGQLLPAGQRPLPLDLLRIGDSRSDVVPNGGTSHTSRLNLPLPLHLFACVRSHPVMPSACCRGEPCSASKTWTDKLLSESRCRLRCLWHGKEFTVERTSRGKG